MVITRQKSRAGANPQYPPRTHPEKKLREVRTLSRTEFTQEQNELFVQLVVQYSQESGGDDLHYHVIGLNESSTENDMKILS